MNRTISRSDLNMDCTNRIVEWPASSLTWLNQYVLMVHEAVITG